MMSLAYAILISFRICLGAAALEGLCAGKNVKSYFATLTFPPYAAPPGVWYGIGFVYYAIFFALKLLPGSLHIDGVFEDCHLCAPA
ncbi:MAG TPA: hypothetical protein VJT71_07160 [Pyrinomonadaceae bacterium]|nr:hypothetical protein [Pyrinomonadaceae bacterium]